MDSYARFAAIYDALMTDVDYDAWAAYYVALMEKSGIVPRRAADCACGTGNMTLRLAQRGIQMTGLDLSMDMLGVAGEKARAKCLQIPFIRQDLRSLRLHRPMDAILCACDGVNYLTDLDAVRSFLEGAHAALRPGGGLFFDISSAYKLEKVLGENCLAEDREDLAYQWINHFDPRTRVVQMDLTFFQRSADGRFDRFRETHFQRAHTEEELRALLREAGFIDIQTYGDRVFSPPEGDALRIHFAARRPEA